MSQFQVEKLIAYDIEVYRNYFLFGALDDVGNLFQFDNPHDLKAFLSNAEHAGYEFVGFNSANYDDPVTGEWVNCSKDDRDLYAFQCSGNLINKQIQPWNLSKWMKSIDLMLLLPGRMSLKQIGVRLGHDRLQELPIDPEHYLEEKDKAVIRTYNVNDLQITWKLIHALKGELELRSNMSREYGLDLRSKGDAQIAEAVIASEISKVSTLNIRSMKSEARKNMDEGEVQVQLPSWWQTLVHSNPGPQLQYILDNQFPRFNTPIPLDHNGRLLKGALNSIVYLDDAYYQTGMGGLHSIDGPGRYQADADTFLMDIDVTSYYPYIWLTQRAFPRHLHAHFGEVYERILNERVAAKKAGNMVVANSLKLTANSSFGKTSDPYSALFDPQSTAAITITGQTALLILIAMLADVEINTVSANTDGVTVQGPRHLEDRLRATVSKWEVVTGLNMEYTEYKATYARDVNSYMAIKSDCKIKSKGAFVTPAPGKHDLRHSLNFSIAADAVKAFLTDLTEVEVTVQTCRDMNRFLITHAATGKFRCYYGNKELGKLIRFYKSTRTGLPRIVKVEGSEPLESGDQVPNSENCVPVMDLPDEFPDDIDYEWYQDKADEWLLQVDKPKLRGNNTLAQRMATMGYTPAWVPEDPSARPVRSYLKPGSMDFNSPPKGMRMGISTGKKAGVVAAIDTSTGHPLLVYKTKHPFPPSTRKKIEKDANIKIYYGANVWFPKSMLAPLQDIPEIMLRGWYREFYTPAELKKIGVVLDDQ